MRNVEAKVVIFHNVITSSIQKYAVLSHFRGKKAAYFM